MGQNPEIFSREVRGDVRLGSAPALAALVSDLIFEGALLFGSIVIGVWPNLVQGSGL